MELFNKPLNKITREDIENIVQTKVPESRTLDYKRELHKQSDQDNKEFLKDVSAFANTFGGFLIYGIDEEKGEPTKILGIEIEDFDKLKQRYESLLRTGVDPVIRGVDFHSINVDNSKKVVIVNIPRSISRPHAVKIDKYRFYGRNSSGVHQLEVEDLKKAFLESETLAIKIRTFRNDRIAAISTNDTFVPLFPGGKIILHLIPDSSFELGRKYEFGDDWSSLFLPFHHSGGFNHKITFDGIMTYDYDPEKGFTYCYTHVYNNGVLEAVDAFTLQVRDDKIIPFVAYEQELIVKLGIYLSSFERYHIELPAWVCLSLTGVKDYVMLIGYSPFNRKSHPIDRDELIVSPIRIENYNLQAEKILKPAFDSVWNACGYKQSLNYKDGEWKSK